MPATPAMLSRLTALLVFLAFTITITFVRFSPLRTEPDSGLSLERFKLPRTYSISQYLQKRDSQEEEEFNADFFYDKHKQKGQALLNTLRLAANDRHNSDTARNIKMQKVNSLIDFYTAVKRPRRVENPLDVPVGITGTESFDPHNFRYSLMPKDIDG